MNRRARRFERGFNSEPLAVLPAPPRRQSLRQRGRGNTGGILFRNRQRTGQGAVYQVQITFRELTQHLDKDLRGGSSPSVLQNSNESFRLHAHSESYRKCSDLQFFHHREGEDVIHV
ncbi:uncharacterized protein si:ch211-152f22.4 isoform X2 [Esox lucius]|uniref:uncharacterized protein si:ch211-152f22.4 isoform X2 n=1 Tax=Esox lucius TaxID=8010 RepID=UPI0009733CF9|nr:uncharacterized protein si:ch211-152f22.4 isoform X2 [Esox lucius]